MMTMFTVVVLASLTAWTGLVVDRSDAARRRGEETISRLAAIVTSSSDGIIGKSIDGTVTSWNPGAEAIYGYPAQEIIGRSIFMVIPPDHRGEFATILERVKQGQRVNHYETVRACKDGHRIYVSLSVSPVIDSAGKIVGASTIARDVTERKRAEEELRRASLYARSLIDASLDPLVTISKDGKIMDVNQATERATGVDRKALIGSDFSEYFTDPAKARQGYEQVFANESVRDYPLAIRHTSGSVMHVLYNASLFKNESGQIEGAFAAARDVTDRQRAQESLNRSEMRYRSLVTATSQIVWSTNPLGEVVDDMPTWRAYTGMTLEQIQGSGWINSLHPEDRDRTAEIWTNSLRERSLYDTEYRIRRCDGEYRIFAVRGVPVQEEDGKIREWVGTCTDITERKRVAEQLRRLNEELEQRVIQRTAQLEAANKELEAFTYSVSHDLRAPLRHISGFSRLLIEEFGPSLAPEARHHLDRIQEGTRRMGLLVDDLLNLGRIGRSDVHLQVTGLNTVVNETLADLKAECAGRQLEWKIGNLPFVECDPGLMKQVFQNLLSNAVKFTRPRSQAVIEVGQKEQNGTPVLFVRDNGVGFNMKYADKLFGVFQRLHRAEDFEGTGVGLATVQRIIQKHGGRIWVEAELDKGATFYFTLGGSEKSSFQANPVMIGDPA